ncbi:acetoacetate decarboxylase family protein [Algoriphagus boritolerans]|uniref:Acetoacetate decarboxylase (ADC) n=1 Tax=Algoriphagus boritolerans DSM 17298 = JCM 18970 TaxID=1120964 RepID=A0A1H5SYC4_9BACT|nr:acetoacetate decarboxylase family protein [Algoriphagus boritolerans]SEF55550.1 Acetoacetate decarboxylase (ADC) [Algoriphagus boritolerans DSM 17298 = JCM 18970]
MHENQLITKDLKLVLKSPPPWKLNGEAIILIFKFKKDWIEKFGLLPKHLKGRFKGGLGYVMLIKYEKSPVGPYHELLFLPGKFRKSKKQAITKIYVDTLASAQNGRTNWGIPKETLPFIWKKEKNRDIIQLKSDNQVIFSTEITHGGISFPVSTSFLPINLCQTWNKVKYNTKPTGFGWGKLAKVQNLDLNPDFFPDIQKIKPLLAIRINPFQINFPEPTFEDEIN